MRTVNRPRILDLYSCAGGAGEGYRRAGFEVVGVDLDPQPHYPFEFHQADAIAYVLAHGHEFDAIHASPPCQLYSAARNKSVNSKRVHPDLVGPTRDALRMIGKPYIIENVVGAPMEGPITLCGGMFGLTAPDVDGVPLKLLRHRLFESNIELAAPEHTPHRELEGVTASVFGSGGTWSPEFRDRPKRGGYVPHISVIRELMGIDWMNRYELSQSIPPAYTEYLGKQLLRAV